MSMPQYLSNYDYRDHTLYTHISGNLSSGQFGLQRLLKHCPQGCVTDLQLSTLAWPDSAAVLYPLYSRSFHCQLPTFQDMPPEIMHEHHSYLSFFDGLSYFKRRQCPLLSQYIESFQVSSIPLQEFWIYLDAWKHFGSPARSNPFLSLMAFYSAVVVGDILQAQDLVAEARQVFSSLPVNSLLYVMTSNIFCLYLIRLGTPLIDVLRLNSSIINKISVDEPEALSILLLNRARLMARLGSSSQALRNLQLSFSLRCELAAPPFGLILLYLLYYLRWSDSCITYTHVLDLIGVPGLSSLSWRMASLLNLPAQTRVILVNRKFVSPDTIACSKSLSEWATYLSDNL